MTYPLAQVTVSYQTLRDAVNDLRAAAAEAFDAGYPADGVRIASTAYRLESAREYGVPLRTHHSSLLTLTEEEARQFVVDEMAAY